jgi:hypothetical protein
MSVVSIQRGNIKENDCWQKLSSCIHTFPDNEHMKEELHQAGNVTAVCSGSTANIHNHYHAFNITLPSAWWRNGCSNFQQKISRLKENLKKKTRT